MLLMSIMEMPHFSLFETALGRCGLAWRGAGLVAVSFPEADEEMTKARLRRRARNALELSAVPDNIGKIVARYHRAVSRRASRSFLCDT